MSPAPSLKIELERAFQLRRSLLEGSSCVRLFDGAGDGVAEVAIDLYDQVLNCHLHNAQLASDLAACVPPALEAIADLRSVRGGFLWLHQQRGIVTEGRCIRSFGEPDERCVIVEHGIHYEVRPGIHKSAGLFIDMRDVRRRLVERTLEGAVLNAFCFTGSLGLAAALGGASPVVQIDVSKSALTWAKHNQSLNAALSHREMKYIPEDSLRYFEREAGRVQRGKQAAALVIIDPPSFGRGPAGEFKIERDLPNLVAAAAFAVRPDGELIVTCNTRTLSVDDIEFMAKETLAQHGRTIKSCERVVAPQADFRDVTAEATSARGVWVTLAERRDSA
ncbi:MAG: class I SAM-dependent methyltransferase [Bdellovibrionota bacterium]|nr:MAG: class I SAM-dependent methyltransferase [Bdellovibrionota bacterium]